LEKWKEVVTEFEATHRAKLPHFIDYLGGISLDQVANLPLP